jgi:hypothetical protein
MALLLDLEFFLHTYISTWKEIALACRGIMDEQEHVDAETSERSAAMAFNKAV